METIIKSQQAELITLHENTSTLKYELDASEERTTFLKEIVKEFSSTLAGSREELRDLRRQCQALKLEVRCLKNPTVDPRDIQVEMRREEEERQRQMYAAAEEKMRREAAATAADSATIITSHSDDDDDDDDSSDGDVFCSSPQIMTATTATMLAGRERETRAVAVRLHRARAQMTHHLGEITHLNEDTEALARKSLRLARENEALERRNAALRQIRQRIPSAPARLIHHTTSTTTAHAVPGARRVRESSEEPELLMPDEDADDSESHHELFSPATSSRSSASSQDIGAMCFPRKFHVHHELTELRARRLVSGSDLHSSYENVGPILRK